MNALLSNLSIIQASSSFPELSARTIAEAVTRGTFLGVPVQCHYVVKAALPTTALPGAWVMGQEIDKYLLPRLSMLQKLQRPVSQLVRCLANQFIVW